MNNNFLENNNENSDNNNINDSNIDILFFKVWRNIYILNLIISNISLKYTKIKKYSEIHSVDWMLKHSNFGLIEDKVKTNQYLTFPKSFKLISFFKIIKKNEDFYRKLLQYYKQHIIHLNDVCEEACISGNITALNIFLKDTDFKPQKSLIDIAIKEGNLELLNHLFSLEEPSLKEFSEKELLNNIFLESNNKNYNEIANYLIHTVKINLSNCNPYQIDISIYLKCDIQLFEFLYSKDLIIVDQNSLSFQCMDNLFEYNGKTLKKYIEFLVFVLNRNVKTNGTALLLEKMKALNLSEEELEIPLSQFEPQNLEIKKLIEIYLFDLQDVCSFRFQNHGINEIEYAIKYNDILYLRNLNQKIKQKGIEISIEYGNSEALLEITSSQKIVFNSTINKPNAPTLFKYCQCREKQRIFLQTFLYHVNCVSEKDYIFKLALKHDDLEIIQFIHHLMVIYGVFVNKSKKTISSDMLQYVQSVKVLTYLCQNKKDFNFNYISLLKRERFDLIECFEQFSIVSRNDTSLLNEPDLSLNIIKFLDEKGYSCTYKAFFNARKSIDKYKYLVENRTEKYSYSDFEYNQNSWILLNYIYDKRQEDIKSHRFEIDTNYFEENVVFLYYSNNHDKMFSLLSKNMDLSSILLKEMAKKCDIETIDKYMSIFFPNESSTIGKHHLIHLLESATKCGYLCIFKLLYEKYPFVFKGVKGGNANKLNCLHDSRLVELTLITMENNYLDLFFYLIDVIKLIPNDIQMLIQLRLRPSLSIKHHLNKRFPFI
ncbi:hypothetical protein DICPUDRAFT_51234 [Dictyostelium purpureum]|uniref:Uncharacterized protein n=1 Tax=Dictyostelium purpureum TaxID=5786 RepID=F1A2S3_DICPU|nr:uncharacterized protein DICPUDRAFT_51234 [Dictyostelium purpureum]EGC29507.1 hypothetical protein DICPUDRAFT_51234 [Dictyostelium purpureum]|eukprot:XP_003293967.1 hypothetical protein DICPUDRAFT_51234 [Dictyostelium purpureum]